MLVTAVYFAAAYLVLTPFLYRLLGLLMLSYRQSSKRALAMYGAFLVLVLAIPFVPYLHVATLTRSYGNELKRAAQNSIGLWSTNRQPFQRFWVLDVSPRHAVVYVTQACEDGPNSAPGDACASRLRFVRQDTSWQFRDWSTVWSDNGMAKRNIFPPDPFAP